MIKTIFYFGAEWCHACKMLKSVIEDIKQKNYSHIKYEYIDCDNEAGAQLVQLYNIKSIPVLIFFDQNDKELWRHEGYMSLGDLMHKIDEFEK